MGATVYGDGQAALPGVGKALTARCSGCKEAKPLDKFAREPAKRNGRASRCNACKNKQSVVWRANNKDRARASFKDWRARNKGPLDARLRKKLYGISEDQYAEMLKRQGGVCAICKATRKLHVDHCHTSGQFRGLLCSCCNTGLGQFKDDERLLTAAIDFLRGVRKD